MIAGAASAASWERPEETVEVESIRDETESDRDEIESAFDAMLTLFDSIAASCNALVVAA